MAYDEVFVPLVTETHFKNIFMQHFHQYSPQKQKNEYYLYHFYQKHLTDHIS